MLVVAQSVLRILLKRRNAKNVVVRLESRALIHQWCAAARGAAA